MVRKRCRVKSLILWVALAALCAAASDQLNVSTLAGSSLSPGTANGPGSNAQFYNPQGVVLDPNGNVYVADAQNNVVRKITPNGFVSTLAGQMGVAGSGDGPAAQALFNGPYAVAIDRWGNLYVAETANCTIRKISPAGMVSTLAGTQGIPGSADGQGTQAQFNTPEGLAVDVYGNVFVADTGNHTIRMITPGGTVRTLAGRAASPGSADGPADTTATFNGPTGIALDADGNIFVADNLNYTVRELARSGEVSTVAGAAGYPGSVDGTGKAARFQNPFGLAMDGNGNLYVSDYTNNTIRRIAPGGIVTTPAGVAPQIGHSDGIGPQARFTGPAGLACDSSGNLYIADSQNNAIRKGVVVPAAATPTFSPGGGTYSSAQTVGIYCATTGAIIYYSTDGTTPTAASAQYTGVLTVSQSTTIKAYAVAAGLIDSDIASAAYSIVVIPPPVAYNQTLATIVNTPVTIRLSASNPSGGTLTYTLASAPAQGTLADFDAATGKVTYTPAQDYTGSDSFTFTVDNGFQASAPGTVKIIVQTSGGGGSQSSNSNIDSDGDGFPDEIEITLGSDPYDPNSTPLGGMPAGLPGTLRPLSLAIRLSFAPYATGSGRDTITLSGWLPVPDGFSARDQTVMLDIGGVVKSFTLDSKGQSLPSSTESFKLRIKATKGMVKAQDAKFVAKLSKGTFAPPLQDEGLINGTAKGIPVVVPVLVLFNGTLFRRDLMKIYTARAGSSGRAR